MRYQIDISIPNQQDIVRLSRAGQYITLLKASGVSTSDLQVVWLSIPPVMATEVSWNGNEHHLYVSETDLDDADGLIHLATISDGVAQEGYEYRFSNGALTRSQAPRLGSWDYGVYNASENDCTVGLAQVASVAGQSIEHPIPFSAARVLTNQYATLPRGERVMICLSNCSDCGALVDFGIALSNGASGRHRQQVARDGPRRPWVVSEICTVHLKPENAHAIVTYGSGKFSATDPG